VIDEVKLYHLGVSIKDLWRKIFSISEPDSSLIKEREIKMDEQKYEVVKFIDDELELEVNVDPSEETIWLSQLQIAMLFGKDRKTITRHILNILKHLELEEKQVCSKNEHTATDGKTYIINVFFTFCAYKCIITAVYSYIYFCCFFHGISSFLNKIKG